MSNTTLTALDTTGSCKLFEIISSSKIISDMQWCELQRLSGMTDADRLRLDVEIDIHYNTCLYHQNARDLPTLSHIADQLKRLSQSAHQLKIGIDNFFGDVSMRHLYGCNGYKDWKYQKNSPLPDHLMRFAQWAEDTAERCGRTRPGPKSDNLRAHVRNLAQMWTKATGEKASARKARLGPDKTWNFVEFVVAVMKIADPAGSDPKVIVNLINNMRSAGKFR